jgi:hypothetical protein
VLDLEDSLVLILRNDSQERWLLKRM